MIEEVYMVKRIKVGDTAQNFTLKDQNGQEIQLSDYRGKNVLLSFHPLAWTNVCAEQMKSLEEAVDIFEDLNTIALGVSVDSVPSKRAWADHLGIEKTRLLSDFWPHGDVAETYSIFRDDDGVSERANIVIDEHQKVRFVKVYPISELPDIEEIVTILKKNRYSCREYSNLTSSRICVRDSESHLNCELRVEPAVYVTFIWLI